MLGVAVALAVLGVLLVWSALRRAPEEQVAADFTADVLSRDPEQMPEAEREEMRRQWERFSPETRREVMIAVARDRLDHFREEAAKLTPEERSQRIQDEIARARSRHQDMPAAERERIRERLNSEEGREMVKQLLTFYQTELTAKERAELDPLVHEWFDQTERLMQP